MGLEKAVEGVAGAKAKQAAQLRLGKLTAPVFFERERFERPAREVAAGRLKPFRHIVWNLDGYLHAAKPSSAHTLWARKCCSSGRDRLSPTALQSLWTCFSRTSASSSDQKSGLSACGTSESLSA